jgi:uncharacterized integral membrane protein (TIGR00697 family)
MKLKVEGIKNSIVIYSSGGEMLTLDSNIIINRGLIGFFSKNDRLKIRISSGLTLKALYDQRFLSGLSALLIAILILAIPMSPYNVTIFNTVQPLGILIFPLSFIVIDSVNEIFGYNQAKYLCVMASLIMLLSSFLIYVSLIFFDVSGSYYDVFHKLPKLYLINGVCIIIADQLNNRVFHFFKKKLIFSALWVRCMISTLVGQAAYTIIWISIFFNVDNNINLLSRILDNYTFKIMYSACVIPFTYIAVLGYKRYKPLDF